MINSKKIILRLLVFLFIFTGLAGIFLFLWQKSQSDVNDLNKKLPAGVRVEKSLLGEEYKVVNKIDGYEFKIPKAWKGISEINYIPERTEKGYTASSIGIEGKNGGSRIVTIDRFNVGKFSQDVNLWAKNNFKTFGLVGDFVKDNVGGVEVVKTQENVHLLGMFVYFFEKNSWVYAITNGSEDFIKEIIINGKW